uniref:Putative secreted protein n=1 Tax=Anopheles darlingi TaxID=43151 RepID=A0A2M4DHM9_ANODA
MCSLSLFLLFSLFILYSVRILSLCCAGVPHHTWSIASNCSAPSPLSVCLTRTRISTKIDPSPTTYTANGSRCTSSHCQACWHDTIRNGRQMLP